MCDSVHCGYRKGFIDQLVEQRSGITEVIGSNPVEASELFLDFICNCFSCIVSQNKSDRSKHWNDNSPSERTSV